MPPRTTRTTRPKTILTEGVPSAMPAATPKQRRFSLIVFVMAVLLLVMAGIAGYFYYQYRQSSQVKDAKETEELVMMLGKVMELPQDETPTLATVTDREKLAGQPFFRKAENGDKVLIYSQSGKAILYRPSTKKIVDVTTVNISAPEETKQPAPAPTTQSETTPTVPVVQSENPTVALYNGSTKLGVTNTLEDQITGKFPNVQVAKKDKAAKNDYTGTQVIDLSGKNVDLAKNIADMTGGTVTSALPEGETNPGTDILVIVGNQK